MFSNKPSNQQLDTYTLVSLNIFWHTHQIEMTWNKIKKSTSGWSDVEIPHLSVGPQFCFPYIQRKEKRDTVYKIKKNKPVLRRCSPHNIKNVPLPFAYTKLMRTQCTNFNSHDFFITFRPFKRSSTISMQNLPPPVAGRK